MCARRHPKTHKTKCIFKSLISNKEMRIAKYNNSSSLGNKYRCIYTLKLYEFVKMAGVLNSCNIS